MKESELMIGDWVICKYYQDRPCYMQFGIGDFQKGGYAFCEPIPLTAEILEKNGFNRSEVFVEWKYEDDDVYMIYKPFPYLKIEMDESVVAFPCEYVHELQHALRLCGVEKEIIL